MRYVQLLCTFITSLTFLQATNINVELEDQTGARPHLVPKVYVAFSAADPNFDTSLYLSGLAGEEIRPVRHQNFTHLGVFLYMFNRTSVLDAPFEGGVTARDLLYVSLRGAQNIKIVVSGGSDSQYFLSLFINGLLIHGPQVTTTFSMEVDPKSLSPCQEV